MQGKQESSSLRNSAYSSVHGVKIWRNCKPALERLQPRAILFEEQARKSAPDGPIGALLQSIGYSVFGIRKLLNRIDLAPLTCERDCNYNDYIAISHERVIPKKAIETYKTNSNECALIHCRRGA